MSSSTEQPTGTEGPLRYAPRGPRDDLKAARNPQATKGGALRGVESDADENSSGSPVSIARHQVSADPAASVGFGIGPQTFRGHA